MLDFVEMTMDGVAFPIYLAALLMSWSGPRRSVARLEGAHRLFMLVLGVNLIRLGFDVTSGVEGPRYWATLVAQSLIIGTTILMIILTGRHADQAERKAVRDLAGERD